MSKLTKAVARAEGLLPRNRNVLAFLAESANYQTGKCFPSHDTIARKTGLSRRTVIRALADLERDGWITRERRHRRDGSRTSDLITVVDPAEQMKAEERIRLLPLMRVIAGAKPVDKPVDNVGMNGGEPADLSATVSPWPKCHRVTARTSKTLRKI